jgi:predicted Zn-dependent protease
MFKVLRNSNLVPLGLISLALGGCISTEQAAQMGGQEHPKILQSYGGTYSEKGLDRYVTQVGQGLAAKSELAGTRFTFTLLDTPVVNAFALPGGYVYVTRGILSLANSESELAGVVGHEIGHITGNHTAKRYNQSVLAGLGSAAIGIATGSSELAQLAQSGSQLYLLSYSRDQEYQSDEYGVRYMKSANYDPYAMGDFLNEMGNQQAVHSKIAGQTPDANRVDFFSTHPNSADRADRAYRLAKGTEGLQRGQLPTKRTAYLNAIDGMLYGDNPAQGYVRGRRFSHPGMRFTFEAPQGFQLMNQPNAVVGQSSNGGQLQFDAAQDYRQGQALTSYLGQVWGPKLKVAVSNVRTGTVNGISMATGTARASTSNGAVDVRLVAYQYSAGQVYRMILVTPTGVTGSLASSLDATVKSFRRLSDAEAAKLRPLRIKVVTVQRGDTVSSLSRRMAFGDHREARFRALNGLSASAGLKAGELVKIVVEG